MWMPPQTTTLAGRISCSACGINPSRAKTRVASSRSAGTDWSCPPKQRRSRGSVSSPSTMCRSVRQTPQASTRNNTWWGAGRGSALSTAVNGPCGRSNTISGIGVTLTAVSTLSTAFGGQRRQCDRWAIACRQGMHHPHGPVNHPSLPVADQRRRPACGNRSRHSRFHAPRRLGRTTTARLKEHRSPRPNCETCSAFASPPGSAANRDNWGGAGDHPDAPTSMPFVKTPVADARGSVVTP